MKMLTVFIPERYLEILDMLVLEERFPNRSEAIRNGIRDLIRNELILKKIVDKQKEKQLFETQSNFSENEFADLDKIEIIEK
jgi:Arc/MetJ-type ribon-helix-helix transcriptional regulator